MTTAPLFPVLDELIAAGWGDTPQDQIPADWRTRRGPDASFSSQRKQAMAAGQTRKWAARQSTRGFARLKDAAARMRAKYLTPMRVSRQRNAQKRWRVASRKALKYRGKSQRTQRGSR